MSPRPRNAKPPPRVVDGTEILLSMAIEGVIQRGRVPRAAVTAAVAGFPDCFVATETMTERPPIGAKTQTTSNTMRATSTAAATLSEGRRSSVIASTQSAHARTSPASQCPVSSHQSPKQDATAPASARAPVRDASRPASAPWTRNPRAPTAYASPRRVNTSPM
eukprot:Amastigsp_a345330_15.p3 type:complete len:164 gc:universal Amastigsp_a345330_15:508-999(+)